MKKVGNNDITSNQLMTILIGTMLGIGILSLPGDLVKTAQQDAWISAALGAVYPGCMVILFMLIYKKRPKKNILLISTEIFGKFLGNLLNVIFILSFLVYAVLIISGIKNILYTFIVAFLTPFKILIVIVFSAVYTGAKELKVLGRINEIVLFLTFGLILMSFIALFKGSYLNICPIGQSGMLNIVKASIDSAYAFGDIEILFLIYPNVTDTGGIKASVIKSVIITMLIYVWTVFITIYFAGIDFIPHSIWPFLLVTKAIEVPVINNLRFVFMIFWTIVIIKTIANNYYALTYGISTIIKSNNRKIAGVFTTPIIFLIPYLIENETVRRNYLSKIIPWYTIYNIIYVTIIVMFLYIKRDDKYEKG